MGTIVQAGGPTLNELSALFDADEIDTGELADAILADGWVERFAERAEDKTPGGRAGLLRVDQVVARVADSSMRVLASVAVLGKIGHVAGDLNGPAWQQCPTFHAYTTLAGIELQLGNEAGSEAWLVRLAEIEPAEGVAL